MRHLHTRRPNRRWILTEFVVSSAFLALTGANLSTAYHDGNTSLLWLNGIVLAVWIVAMSVLLWIGIPAWHDAAWTEGYIEGGQDVLAQIREARSDLDDDSRVTIHTHNDTDNEEDS